MKKLYYIISIFASIIFNVGAQSSTNTVMVQVPAQVTITTNIPNLLGDLSNPSVGNALAMLYNETVGSSNFIVAPFYGRKLQGNANAAGMLACYDLNSNVGLVGGVDHLWSSGAAPSTFTLAGGLQIQTVIHPLARFGLTNFIVHPFAMSLVGTPMNGNNSGNVMNLNRAGAYVDVPITKDFQFDVGAAYGNRTGCGTTYDGNWVNLFIAFGYKIPGQ